MKELPEPAEVAARAERFRRLPEPIRYEDLRTSQDVDAHLEPVGEADRERSWLLRTAGAI
jgi:hypothetical protein